MSKLVPPHGGKGLVCCLLEGKALEDELQKAKGLKQIEISSRAKGDLIMMGIGGFSPLDGFMDKANWKSVCDNMLLTDGTFWPVPITMDISADLEELGQTPVMVVCAGAKSILDLGLTLEYLETHGVPVIGYGTEELPAFYTRKSGFKVDYRIDTPAELAKAFYVKQDMGLGGGMLVTNPIPEEYSMDHEVINKAIDEAVAEANKLGIHGKETTPFLLAKIKDITGGDSLASNIQLVYNNARLAAKTAGELVALAKN